MAEGRQFECRRCGDHGDVRWLLVHSHKVRGGERRVLSWFVDFLERNQPA